jgi:cytochrome P450
VPILGNIVQIIECEKRLNAAKDNTLPLGWLTDDLCKPGDRVFMCFLSSSTIQTILCPKIVEDLYTKHNKYFDKHDLVRELLSPMLGSSILLADTNETWRAKRKALAPTFYKGRLPGLIDIATNSVRKTLARIKSFPVNSDGAIKIDLISEVSRMQSRIMLDCILGEDITELNMDFWKDGKCVQENTVFVLRQTFADLISRLSQPLVVFFPSTVHWFITRFERDTLKNANNLRAFCMKITNQRRKELTMEPEKAKLRNDVLTILLSDDLFKDND